MDRFEKLQIFNLSLLLGGYLIATYLAPLLGVESRFITIPYRALSLVVSLSVIFIGINKGRAANFNIYHKLIIAFWVLFLIRMFYDLLLIDLNVNFQYPNKNDYWFYALGVGFFPMLSSLMMHNVYYNKIYKSFYILLFIGLFISIFSNVVLTDGGEITGRVGANESVQVILYGNMGAFLIILAICGFKLGMYNWFNIASILLGVSVLLKSGTRGSIISLVLILIVYFAFRGIDKKFKMFKVLTFLSFFLILVFSFWTFIYEKIYSFSPILATRLNLSFEGGDSAFNGRNVMITQAFNDFLNNPFIGNHFVLIESFGAGYYPHNSIAEAFMALGFFGGCLFLFLIIKSSLRALKLINIDSDKLWIGLLFLQNLMYSMSSTALYKHQAMWIFMVMLFSLNFNINKNKC